jgi:hypothetical protein
MNRDQDKYLEGFGRAGPALTCKDLVFVRIAGAPAEV